MRVAMGVEYDGTDFYGWQTQAQEPTVQSVLERALAKVADESIRIHGAGRTDTGVHARAQTFHFDCQAQRTMRSWVLGTNSQLPHDLAIIWAKLVPEDFHARFSALSRLYQYCIINRWVRPVIARRQVLWVHQKLNVAKMQEAAQALLGEHDFTSFRAVACQAKHARRRILRLDVVGQSEHLQVNIEGNAFLHHMVRNIVGSLIEVGLEKRPPEWIQQVLDARDRDAAGVTAAAQGLCLQAVRYPAHYSIPIGPESEIRT